jgi:hypothetical protein
MILFRDDLLINSAYGGKYKLLIVRHVKIELNGSIISEYRS